MPQGVYLRVYASGCIPQGVFSDHCDNHFIPSRFVSSHGYVSLFPLMLKIIDPSSDKLAIVLNNLRNPNVTMDHVIHLFSLVPYSCYGHRMD